VEAVRLTVAPVHITASSFVVPDVSFTVIDGVGNGFTVTDVLEAEEQLLELVTVTEYVALTAGETVIEPEVAPLLHTNETPPVAVIVTASPSQVIPSLDDTPDVSVKEKEMEGNGFTT
jgi:hypothetical protein